MDFKDRFQAAVRAEKTTQEEVARLAGVNRVTVSKWMGKGTFPRADQAVLIARALKVSVEYLVTGVDSKIDPWVSQHAQLISDLKEFTSDELGRRALGIHAEAEAIRAARTDGHANAMGSS